MSYLFKNVFYHKDTESPDEFINGAYWLLLVTKNICKWLFAGYLLSNGSYSLFILLFICPIAKFVLISLGNLYKFKKNFRGSLIIAMGLILLVESFFELPIHIAFPFNRIYLHTNYYKIYDLMKYRHVEILTEISESVLVLIFVIITMIDDIFGLISILSLSFTTPLLVYFLWAGLYFLFCTKKTSINQGTIKSNSNVITGNNIPLAYHKINKVESHTQSEENQIVFTSNRDTIEHRI